MKKGIAKDAITLLIITVVAGTLLGVVHEITAEPIALANYNTQQNAYRAVFEDASEFIDLPDFSSEEAAEVLSESDYEDVTIEGCVQAVDDGGALLGYVVTVTDPNGYGGDITFSIGIRTDGTLNGYSITSISETAGLGMKAKEEAFSSQFKDKQAESFTVTKTGAASADEIDAISGATITSRAVTGGVNAGLLYFRELIGETGGELINE